MAIKVVLIADVPGLGKKDFVTQVKDGYAYNYLFRKQLARPYSAAIAKQLAKKSEVAAQERALTAKLALATKQKLEALDLTFALTVNEQNKAFGSINTAQVLAQLNEQHISIERAALGDLRLDIGTHEVPVKLTETISATLKITVVGTK